MKCVWHTKNVAIYIPCEKVYLLQQFLVCQSVWPSSFFFYSEFSYLWKRWVGKWLIKLKRSNLISYPKYVKTFNNNQYLYVLIGATLSECQYSM